MKKGYYIQLFSPHGLIRNNEPEIGRDTDTGGQVKYVLEFIEALSDEPRIRKIDLFTRKINDKRVSAAYAEEKEIINDKARIIRIPCGGNAYRPKETLWAYLDEFVDKTLRFIEEEDEFPDIVHGHYADGNYLAGQISQYLGIPFIATGHSLGRSKKEILLRHGFSPEKINEKFNMNRRIAEEEQFLKRSDLVIVSTKYEIASQYKLYENLENTRFEVLPPGVNINLFYPFYRQEMPSFQMDIEQEQALYRISSEIEKFLFNPEKPLILSIGRADKRKNFETLIKAYGQDKELQAMANIAIFAGVRKDITKMPEDEQEILTNLLLLLDKYDLYGKMAIPKKNDPRLEVPEIYRLAARKKGVFINAAPGENFGLTAIEAAACGLPAVASPTGGPKEIIENCKNGLLVDVEDTEAIAVALKKIISDQAAWERFSSRGIKACNRIYSWKVHASKYTSLVKELVDKTESEEKEEKIKSAYGKKLAKADLFIVSDIDGTLVEGEDVHGLEELKKWIKSRSDRLVFGVASGRNREITKEAVEQYRLPEPDVYICSAGSEIYYTDELIPDRGWESHIDFQWKRDELQAALEKFPGIELQEESAQWGYKLSYYVNEDFSEDDLADLHKFLDDKKLKTKVLLTQNHFLDFLPFRASKGNAIRYLSYKWKLSLDNFITAGNSGNDIDMLKGKTKAIVVANFSPELENLKNDRNIYFADQPLSAGVLEGIMYYHEETNPDSKDNVN